MTTLILSNEMTPSELYHVAYTAGSCDQLIDTQNILDREDVDLVYLMHEYEEGREVFLEELNTDVRSNIMTHPSFEVFENVESVESNVYVLDCGFLSRKLAPRAVYKNITKEYYNTLAVNAKVIDNPSLLTGNDMVIYKPYHGCKEYQLLTFKQVVTMVTTMGEGFLKWADGGIVTGTPICDFDYQDSTFEYNIGIMQAFMAHYNA